jgi:Ca2+-binding RTX toxin-like protein
MPTQIEYGLMSANVYGNYPDIDAVNPVRSAPNTLPVPDGWTQMDAASGYLQNDTSTGFMAGVYVKDNEIVIAYGGTTDENYLDWIRGNLPAGTGLSTGVAVATQVLQAAELCMKVLTDPQFAGKSITFTGHSLGGGLASLMAVYFNKPAIVFDEAFFLKSADSAAVVNSLRTELQKAGYTVPTELVNYVTDSSALSYLTNSWDPSPTRVAREGIVTNISVKGEILSVISDGTLANAGLIGLPFILGSGFLGPAWLVAGGLALLAGTGVGKVNNGQGTAFDLNAKTNLDWGWGLDQEGIAGNPVDLHSMTLLDGLLLSSNFYACLKRHPELMARLFANESYPNNPKLVAKDNLIEVLVKGQYQGKGTLDILSADVIKIDVTAGLTSMNYFDMAIDANGATDLKLVVNVAAALVDADLAAIYSHHNDSGGTQNSLQLAGNAVIFDGATLSASEVQKGMPGLVKLLGRLTETDGGSHNDIAAPNDARWALQTGTGALNYVAAADDKSDIVCGFSGSDVLGGGGGADVLVGGDGADTLEGGPDNDKLYGGNGADAYIFSGQFGKDVVLDSDGQGFVKIDDQTLGESNGSGKRNIWTAKLDSGQFVGLAVYEDQSSSTGKKLVITRAGNTDNTVTINNFDFDAAQSNGYLGIKLSPIQLIALTQGAGTNFWADPNADINGLEGKRTPLGEGSGCKFIVSLGVAAKAGDTVKLNLTGQTGDCKAVLGDDMVDADGATITLAEGQTEVSFALVQDGGLNADSVGTLSVTYQDADGQSQTSNAWTLSLQNHDDPANVITGDTAANAPIVTDNLSGTANADLINGLTGSDLLLGLAGNDSLEGGLGNDILMGGLGADSLNGGDGDDMILGSSTGSFIGTPGSSTDPIVIAQGDHWLWTANGTDADGFRIGFLTGNVTRDEQAGDAANVIDGGAGNDVVFAGTGDDLVHGGDGADDIEGMGGADVLLGDAGNDRIYGDAQATYTTLIDYTAADQHGSDFIDGGDGNDILLGQGGDDAVYGGAGNDKIWGDDRDPLKTPNAVNGNDYLDGEDAPSGAGGKGRLRGETQCSAKSRYARRRAHDHCVPLQIIVGE